MKLFPFKEDSEKSTRAGPQNATDVLSLSDFFEGDKLSNDQRKGCTPAVIQFFLFTHIFRCVLATLYEGLSVHPSVGPYVRQHEGKNAEIVKNYQEIDLSLPTFKIIT